MAFNFYPFGIAEVYRGNVDLLNDSIRILSTRTGFSFNAAHQDLADITPTDIDAHAAVVMTISAINDTDAAVVASNVTIPAGTGGECAGFLVYLHTGTDSTSTLICHFSGAAYTYTPSGSTQALNWTGNLLEFSPTGNTYDFGMAEIARLNIDLLTADIRAVLIDEADYTFSQAHEFLDDVPSGARVGTPVALASKTISDAGVFDSATVTLSAVTGDRTEGALIFVHTGADATATLISYFSNSEVEVTPNGNNISILTPNGWIDLS